MVTFEPMDLGNQIIVAIEELDFLCGSIEDIDFDVFLDKDQYDDYDVVINEESKVCLYMGQDSYPITTLGYLLHICKELNKSKLNDKQSYAKNQNEVDFLLTVNDYNTMMLLEGLERSNNPIVCKLQTGVYLWKTEIAIEKNTYEIALFKGVCLYHVLVERSGNHDKYLPSYSENDYFVRIVSKDMVDMRVADSLAVSFVFELLSTHGLVLDFSSGRPDPDEVYYDDNELSEEPYGIFPLLYGRGIKEILSLYNKGRITAEPEHKILCFTKVLEYISPTIAQEQLYESVRLKLSSPTVLAPTSDFINELGTIYNKNQSDISKDSELIRLAVITVTDLGEIWDDVSFLLKQGKNKKYTELDDPEKLECLESLATIIYDTRNEIAHAKANYVKKGTECPDENKHQFSKALDKIAIRCIRWFSIQAEDKRVTLSH